MLLDWNVEFSAKSIVCLRSCLTHCGMGVNGIKKPIVRRLNEFNSLKFPAHPNLQVEVELLSRK